MRINENNKNFYFYNTPLKYNKVNPVDHENYILLKETMKKYTNKYPTKTLVDGLILLIAGLPLLVIVEVLVSIFIFLR